MSSTDGIPTEPGVYLDVPDAIYFSIPAASNSRLSLLHRSPLHLKYDMETERELTRAFQVGQAAHRAILEPDLWADNYCRGPEGDRRTKPVKAAWAEARARYGDDYVLRPQDFDQVEGMMGAVQGSGAAQRHLAGEGSAEVVLIWNDEATGLLCKAKVDYLPQGSPYLVDLKTTTDAREDQFRKSVWAYGYHRQAAHYLRGAQALGLERHLFVFLVVEKAPPHGVSVLRIDDAAVEAGAMQLERLLEQYRACMETDTWPGYPDREDIVTLPPWAWAEIDDEYGDWKLNRALAQETA